MNNDGRCCSNCQIRFRPLKAILRDAEKARDKIQQILRIADKAIQRIILEKEFNFKKLEKKNSSEKYLLSHECMVKNLHNTLHNFAVLPAKLICLLDHFPSHPPFVTNLLLKIREALLHIHVNHTHYLKVYRSPLLKLYNDVKSVKNLDDCMACPQFSIITNVMGSITSRMQRNRPPRFLIPFKPFFPQGTKLCHESGFALLNKEAVKDLHLTYQ